MHKKRRISFRRRSLKRYYIFNIVFGTHHEMVEKNASIDLLLSARCKVYSFLRSENDRIERERKKVEERERERNWICWGKEAKRKLRNKVLHSNNNFPLKGDLRSLFIEFFWSMIVKQRASVRIIGQLHFHALPSLQSRKPNSPPLSRCNLSHSLQGASISVTLYANIIILWWSDRCILHAIIDHS